MQKDHWLTHALDADHDPLSMLGREWLLTNGTGAFSAGTAAGCPTRRYHGLLVAATEPPVGRILALNQVWEELVLHRDDDSATQPLTFSTLMFRNSDGERVFAPAGYELLRRFERGLGVRWRYVWGEIEFDRELILHWHQQAATLRYSVRGLAAANCCATLRLHPMVTLRDFHSLCRAWRPLDHKAEPRTLRVYHEDLSLTLDLAMAGDAVSYATSSAAHASENPDSSGVAATARAHAGSMADGVVRPEGFEIGFVPNPHWWYGVHYPTETERGQGDAEDVFVPGAMTVELPEAEETELTLTAALGPEVVEPCRYEANRAAHLEPIVRTLAGSEAPKSSGNRSQRKKKKGSAPQADPLARILALASDDFIVRRRIDSQSLATIIAGYPWFADWGRDTFIALPGLLLETGRFDEAKAVLRAFASNIRRGLVPNRFDDYHHEAAHYNTVDASLWFIHAALQYLETSGDTQAWSQWLAPACKQIVAAYHGGTDFEIRCDDDGLVTAGSHQTQLTWMDAASGDRIFTPRPGKCVEVNALWYNALLALAEALEKHSAASSKQGGKKNARASAQAGKASEFAAPDTPDALQQLANKVKRSFNDLFWDNERNHLRDHVWTDPQGHDEADATCRPNQIFAIALPHSPLPQTKQRHVLAAVRDQLLTPVGLRTLPRDHEQYHGQYRGNQMLRDSAYHQGTIWPWLIGPYAEAVLRVGRFGPKARGEAHEAIAPLLGVLLADHVDEQGRGSNRDSSGYADAEEQAHSHTVAGCIGQLHEIFEAEPDEQGRYRPVGTFAQAWSVSEVLRISRMLSR